MLAAVRVLAVAVFGEVALGRGDGDHELEGVAAADAQVLRHRAEAVGGVQVTVHEGVVVAAPAAFAAEAPEHVLREVVDVGALGMLEFAEEALAGHVQDEELLIAVAAVLDDRAVALGLLRGVDQFPAFVNRDGGRHLDEGVLAALHGLESHRHVPFPRSGDVDHVDVIPGDHLFPGILGVGVDDRLLAGLGLHVVEGALGALGLEVADRHHFGEVDVDRGVDVGHAAGEADERAAHLLQGLGLQVPDRLIAGGAGTGHRDFIMAL
ncbi:alpha-N-acetylgalactosaminidase [Verrucomicrobiota bacterium]|nr:alpha-N-acetylgalactosaminidase [Verrucomicrobiota bacterium]